MRYAACILLILSLDRVFREPQSPRCPSDGIHRSFANDSTLLGFRAHVRTWFDAGVGVVDVDASLAEPRSSPRELSRLVWQLCLSNLGLCVGVAFGVERRLCRGQFVHNDTHNTLSLRRERVKGEDVHSATSENLAELTQGARLIFHLNGELPHDWHGGDLPCFIENADALSVWRDGEGIILRRSPSFNAG